MSRNLVTDFSKAGVREEGLAYSFSVFKSLKNNTCVYASEAK
jgi:hypothetical protein